MAMRKEKGTGNKFRFTFAVLAATALFACSAFIFADTKTQKTVDNTVTPSDITIYVAENSSETTETAYASTIAWEAETEENSEGDITVTYSADKHVQVSNADVSGENNTAAYIRVAIVPKWVAAVASTGTTGTEASEADTTGTGSELSSEATESTETVTVVPGTPTVYGLADFGSLTEISSLSATSETEDSSDDTEDDSEDSDICEYTMGDVTFTLSSDWSTSWLYNSTDGYFYYKAIVEVGDTTKELLSSVSISQKTYKILEAYGISLEVDILADAIQTQGGALDARWSEAGVSIQEDGTLGIESGT